MHLYLKLCWVLFLFMTMTGCPGTGKPAQNKCTQVGQQCKRKQGELGVCTPTSPDSIQPHHLECVAQH